MGNLDAPDLPVESKDEIGILARSFRAMLEELREKAALEQYVASLNLNDGRARRETVTMRATTGRTAGGGASRGSARSSPPATRSSRCSGKGGMGVVYRAHDRDLDDAVAIKTLRGEALSADPTLLDRFKQEIRLARRITHPNVLRTHDLGETGGLRYLSMEFVKGLTLKHLVEAGDILPMPVGPAHRQADVRGPGRGARGRRHPPRHQAAEHPDRGRRAASRSWTSASRA